MTKFMSAMYLKPFSPRPRVYRLAAARGFAIISAIFLIVILAALGTFMVTFSSVQQITSAQDVQGSRAYHAARAGIEWGAYQVLIGGAGCPAPTTLSPAGTLTGFSVAVSCVAFPTTESGNAVVFYQIISTASQGTLGSTTYSERQLKATIGK